MSVFCLAAFMRHSYSAAVYLYTCTTRNRLNLSTFLGEKCIFFFWEQVQNALHCHYFHLPCSCSLMHLPSPDLLSVLCLKSSLSCYMSCVSSCLSSWLQLVADSPLSAHADALSTIVPVYGEPSICKSAALALYDQLMQRSSRHCALTDFTVSLCSERLSTSFCCSTFPSSSCLLF